MASFISNKKNLLKLPEIITSESGYLINEYKDLSSIANGLFSIDNKNLKKENNLRCADVIIYYDEDTHYASMSCQTIDANIYYTLDGSDPNSSKTKYSNSILIDNNCTIKANAWKDGINPSEIASLQVGVLAIIIGYDNNTIGYNGNEIGYKEEENGN